MDIEKIIEAIEELGYWEDGFVTEYITVAFDSEDNNKDDVSVASGDWRQYYMVYEYVFILSDGDTQESIEEEIERLQTIQEMYND